MPTTVTGEVERVTYENEETGFRVIRIGSVPGRGSVPVVGVFPPVGPGTKVRVTGDFVQDPRHGEQFRADTLVLVEPDTLVGLERYLGSGMIPGIGTGFARRIVSTFGLETLKVLDQQPQRLAEVPGLGGKRAEEIQKKWAEQRAISSIMLVLQTHGASPALAARIYNRYGERAGRIVQQQPYRLALEVTGIGFKTADRIAKSLGISGDHPDRVQAGLLHVLEMLADQGHTASTRAALVVRAVEMLAIGADHAEAGIDALWAAGRVVVEGDLVFTTRLHGAECATAGHLRRLLESPGRRLGGIELAVQSFERSAGVELASAQRGAVASAAEHKVLVITGGPGVGKTTVVRAVLSVFERARLTIRLAAPTGRAAKRLSETTGKEASTIHRLLEYEPRLRRFGRNSEHPVDADVLVIDEVSMVDIELAESLLAATPSAARLVLVGDVDQLPSVGPGAFLRDVIESGAVPTVRLVEIFRQSGASRIVENAHSILRGELPVTANIEEPGADFFIIARRDADEAAKTVLELVSSRIPRRFKFDARDDIQVLTPMHRGAAGTIALNTELQRALNPNGAAIERRGQLFRAGDKVMQTRNDYDREVFNGDIGVVVSVEPAERKLCARFDGRDVDFEDADLDMLTLAYATSIHKSQGSEYAAVVIPLLTTHFVMLSRNLLYTAVTRAKKLCCLVADPRALRLALSETRREERLTRLRERLADH